MVNLCWQPSMRYQDLSSFDHLMRHRITMSTIFQIPLLRALLSFMAGSIAGDFLAALDSAVDEHFNLLSGCNESLNMPLPHVSKEALFGRILAPGPTIAERQPGYQPQRRWMRISDALIFDRRDVPRFWRKWDCFTHFYDTTMSTLL